MKVRQIFYVLTLIIWCCGAAYAGDTFGVVTGKAAKPKWWQSVYFANYATRASMGDISDADQAILRDLRNRNIQPEISDRSTTRDGTRETIYYVGHKSSSIEVIGRPVIKHVSVTVRLADPDHYTVDDFAVGVALIDVAIRAFCSADTSHNRAFNNAFKAAMNKAKPRPRSLVINNCKVHMECPLDSTSFMMDLEAR